GTWGISSDLAGISERQRAVVLSEVENYRRMSSLKSKCLYALEQPADGADAASIAYFDPYRKRAAALVYRWDREGEFEKTIKLESLKPAALYMVTDADSGTSTRVRGRDLLRQGLPVHFAPERLSALVFIDQSR